MSKRYVRSNGGNNKWTASSSSSYHHHSSRGRGRGYGRGRSFGRGGRFSNHSFVRNEAPPISANKKWVRPVNNEKEEVGKDIETAALPCLPQENVIRDGDEDKNNDISDSKAGETTTPSSDVMKPEQNLERRGRNKLVLKTKTTEPDISSERKVEHNSDPIPSEFRAGETITSSSDVCKPEQNLERQGRHKLVLKKNEAEKSSSSPIEHATLPKECRKEEQRTHDVHKPEQHLERRGRHKLVLKKDETEAISKPNQNKSTEDDVKYSWKRKSAELTVSSNDEEKDTSKQDGVQNDFKRAGSRTTPPVKRKHHDSIHGPRRICLTLAATEEGKDADGMDEQPQKTMTDFQYKDASARGGRGRGKAMGLVRVKPKNPSETPICPTFSRGLPCNNPKCRLRHDVSTEASRPICVFFQRNGMCSKGEDCPFKHVKISWDAEICPTFERLGYCEDEGCVLRHVASKKSKTKR